MSAGRSRWRAAVPVAILLGALLAALAGADRVARWGAETLLSRDVQAATGVEYVPVVSVRGPVFLPQVVAGRYREVDVSTAGITSGPLRIDRVDSRLTDVRVPFHDVLVRDVRAVGVGRSEETVTLTLADLNTYLADTGRTLTLEPQPDGELRLRGSVDVLNRRIPVSSVVGLTVADAQLRVVPREVQSGSAGLDEASRLLLGQRLQLTVPLGTLPFGHQLSAVEVAGDRIVLRATGESVVVRP